MVTKHKPFFLAIAAWLIGLALALLGLDLDLPFSMTIAADVAFLTYLVLTFVRIPHMTRTFLRKHAAADDLPIWVIFSVIVAALVTAAIAIFILINADPRPPLIQLCLALAALPLGWFTIHLMAASHYAHLFWQPGPEDERFRRRAAVSRHQGAARLGLRLFRIRDRHDGADVGCADHRQPHAPVQPDACYHFIFLQHRACRRSRQSGGFARKLGIMHIF